MSKQTPAHISIEIAYALPDEQHLLALSVPLGTTAIEAVKLSGWGEKFQEIAIAEPKLGIFGKRIKADRVLREHDRVEIYRPLRADPKVMRRKRAAADQARPVK
jgi:uncharacterized protein